MRWGAHLDWLEDQAKAGTVLPALAERPDLAAHLGIVVAAFWDLQGDRAVAPSGCPRPLPFTAAVLWADRHGFDDDRFAWLWDRLRGLDRVYLTHEADRIDRATKTEPR